MVEGIRVSRVASVFWVCVLIVVLAPAMAGAGDDLKRVTAKAAIVVDHRSGDVIYARQPDLKLPPASTTKIMTAHLALRSGKLNQDFRVSRHATTMQPSKIWLARGWKVNVLDLVYASLLNSANDASVVLAEGLAGSVPNFARYMNKAAFEMGATRSQFVNPSGLPAKGHYSTVRDLTTIMRSALRYPQFRQILSTKSTVIRPTHGTRRRIRLRSHNRLLSGKDFQVIGKTGYTRRAKRCFVGAASDGEKEVLVALLGSKNLWGDLRRLSSYGLERGSTGQYQITETDWHEAIAPALANASKGVEETVSSATFHVRLASFRTRSRADGLRKKVAHEGYDKVVVENLLAGSKPLYRVTVRGFSSRETAQKAARSLARAYRVEPQVVAIGA